MSCKSYCENSVFESDCIAYMNTYKWRRHTVPHNHAASFHSINGQV
jgi:hypothetical protein